MSMYNKKFIYFQVKNKPRNYEICLYTFIIELSCDNNIINGIQVLRMRKKWK